MLVRALGPVGIAAAIALGGCGLERDPAANGEFIDFATTTPRATSPLYERYVELAADAGYDPIPIFDFELQAAALCAELVDPSPRPTDPGEDADGTFDIEVPFELRPDEVPVVRAACPEAAPDE